MLSESLFKVLRQKALSNPNNHVCLRQPIRSLGLDKKKPFVSVDIGSMIYIKT